MGETRELTRQSAAVAGAALIGSMLSGLMVAGTAISVFMGHISNDYGWGHGEIGAAVSFLFLGVAVGSPFFGPVVDRIGSRAVLLPLTASSGVILSLFAVIGANLSLFYAAHFLLGLATPGALAYSKLISTWFFKRRGVALTALGLGSALAQVIVPPIARTVMQAVGWRHAYVVFGAAELFFSFPILLVFFRERKFLLADGGEMHRAEVRPDGAPNIEFRQMIGSRTFWVLVGAQVAGQFGIMGVSTHAVGIMGEHGVAPAFAVWGLSILAAGAVVAQVLTGFLLDRFDTPQVILPFPVVSLVGLVILHLSHRRDLVLVAVALMGLGLGGQTSVTSYFTSRYFGVRNFSRVYGSVMPVLLLFGAPAATIIGDIFDRTHSYNAALIVLEVAFGISLVFFAILGPYPYPVKAGAK
jgi:MFS family permease